MADVNVAMLDAGAIAGAVSGVKSRAEQGTGKDNSEIGDERGGEFEQLVANGGKAQGAETDAKIEKPDEAAGRLLRKSVGGAWLWPEGLTVTAPNGKPNASDAEAGETKNVDERARPKVSINMAAEASLGSPSGGAADAQIAAVQTAANVGQTARAGAGSNTGEGSGLNMLPGRTHGQPGTDGWSREATARVAQARGAGTGGEPAGGTEARGANVPAPSTQTASTKQPAPTASHNAGVLMQPGAVEPAVVQLAAVLAQGRETGKHAEPVRTVPETPAKIQVSLTETHFSPVKPDSELEAYDLAQRMDKRAGKEIGRSLRDALRLQAGLRQDVRSEKKGASGQAQGDVRAELLAQNVARPVSGGDIAGQIGTKILQELEQPRSSAETRSSGVVQVKQSDPVLKVLEIRLEPKELGTVVVRMSLRNDVLNVELGFGKSDAAAAIAKSTDQLSHYLRSSGYDVDAIVVRVVDADRAAAPVVNTVSHADSAQGQAPTPGSGSSSSGMAGNSFGEQGERRSGTRDGQSAHQSSGEGSYGQDNSQLRSSSDLFV